VREITNKRRWRGAHGEMASWSTTERGDFARAFPLMTLCAVLSRDTAFQDAVRAVANADITTDVVARRYAPKNGRGRRAVHLVIEEAARGYVRIRTGQPERIAVELAIANVGGVAVWADSPLAVDARSRWRDAATYRHGSTQLARLGAGLCLEPSCPCAVSRDRLWCDPHAPRDADATRKLALRDMRRTLLAAADSLAVDLEG